MASHSKTVAKSGSGKAAKPVSSARSQTPSAAPKKAAPIKVDKTATARASAAKPKAVKATPVAKPAPAAKPAKTVAAKPVKVAAKKVVEPKKPVAPAKKPVAKAAPVAEKAVKAKVAAPAPAPKAPAAKTKSKSAPAVVADAVVEVVPEVRASKPAKADKSAKTVQSDLFQGTFFHEVAVGTPAVRKNKAPQIATPAVRKPKGEESHDELIARIERELLNVRVNSKKVQKLQLCTKCCINPVDTGFMVDRDTGYCEECAIVLGLGHTREARQQNFHPSLMKAEDQDSLE
jgi:hypothetical protein